MAIRHANDSRRLPKFKSRKEEAEFWETHSPMDYPEFEEVNELTFARPLNHILPVRLDAVTSDALAARARKKGLGSSTLARMWLIERLEREEKDAAREANRKARTGA